MFKNLLRAFLGLEKKVERWDHVMWENRMIDQATFERLVRIGEVGLSDQMLFANHRNLMVRAALSTTASDHGVLAKLSRDPEWTVRSNVIFNPYVTRDIIQKMFTDSEPEISHDSLAVFQRRFATARETF